MVKDVCQNQHGVPSQTERGLPPQQQPGSYRRGDDDDDDDDGDDDDVPIAGQPIHSHSRALVWYGRPPSIRYEYTDQGEADR